LKLFPGMTAYVTIPVATVQNVLKLPNTALRYKPPLVPDEVLALYKSHGIEGVKELRTAESGPSETGTATGTSTQNTARLPKAETAVVWKLNPDKTMEPIKVSLGITDHAYTEVSAVVKGDLKESDEVIIRSVIPKPQTLGSLGR